MPIMFMANGTYADQPLILALPFGWEPGSFARQDGAYLGFMNGRILTLADVKPATQIWLVHADAEYSPPAVRYDLYADATQAILTDEEFTLRMADGFPDEVRYSERERMRSGAYYVNNQSAPFENLSFNATPLYASYHGMLQGLNHTTVVFAKNPAVYGIVDLAVREGYGLMLSFVLDDYTTYYSNAELTGSINYSSNRCTSFTADLIDFSDGESGILFYLERDSGIRFCAINTTELRLNLTIPFDRSTVYRIVFHTDPLPDVLDRQETSVPRFGVTERERGFTYTGFEGITGIPYDALKAYWDYPSERDFAFTVTDAAGTVFEYEPDPPGLLTNVYARRTRAYLLDEYGNRTRIDLTVRTW
ncbi:hypothetical protein JXB02_02425 [Candidatus Woesearchaeota archaeon]|nr:hypothetical protein [Candidatus Woesearchaeota archaeon]